MPSIIFPSNNAIKNFKNIQNPPHVPSGIYRLTFKIIIKIRKKNVLVDVYTCVSTILVYCVFRITLIIITFYHYLWRNVEIPKRKMFKN